MQTATISDERVTKLARLLHFAVDFSKPQTKPPPLKASKTRVPTSPATPTKSRAAASTGQGQRLISDATRLNMMEQRPNARPPHLARRR